MATMNISLPEDLKSFVDEQVAAHAYGSTSEYLREKLRSMLLEGFRSGPGQVADDAFFAGLRNIADGQAEP
jgi:antitoxin ParD1/3/4